MIKEAIKYLVEMGGIHKESLIDGSEYVSSGEDSRIINKPVLEPIVCNTLTGIVDFINMNETLPVSEQILINPVCIHIISNSRVELIGNFNDDWRTKKIWVKAKCDDYSLGRVSKSLEEFLVLLQSFFVQDSETRYLLSILSKITAVNGVEVTDKGVSLAIERKKDIHFKESDDIRSQFAFCPYRTFTEIEQPESLFILRVQGDSEKGINIVMEQTTDPTWKISAIERIKEFFQGKITDKGITIIA